MFAVRSVAALIAIGVLITACAPTRPTGTGSAGISAAVPREASQPTRALSMVMRVEPRSVMDSYTDRSAVHKALFTSTLGSWNLQAEPFPVLAEALPKLGTDTWRVLPDGRMETVYRLRPGLTWHDGTPLTAQDVAFSRRSANARIDGGLDSTDAESMAMEEVVAQDARTVLIRWRQPYPEAAAPDLIIVARHLLEPVLEAGDLDAFATSPYWTSEWVGAGPYRLDRWERGAHIDGVAFAGYALGAPKISRVRLTWNNDPNVSLARLMSGDADVALDGSIRFEQASILRKQWTPQNSGTTLLNPTSLRYLQFQFRSAYTSPKALLDVRARRAMVHAIDRSAMADAMVEDMSMVADTVPPPTAPYFAAVDKVTTKYPFDLRRTEQLLGELGYARSADGVYTSPTEGRFQMEVRGVSGGDEERDTTIAANDLQLAGFDPTIMLLSSSARSVDERTKGTFPGVTLNNNTLQRGLGLQKWLTINIAGPENNWVAVNRMGWSNPEYDRLYNQWTTSLDRAQWNDSLVQMMKLISEELPSPALYYNFQVLAHTNEVRGPQALTPDSTRYSNVREWEWTR